MFQLLVRKCKDLNAKKKVIIIKNQEGVEKKSKNN